MKRRTFLTLSSAVAANTLLSANETTSINCNQATKDDSKEYSVCLKHNLNELGEVSKIWLPLPKSRPYQYLTSDIINSGNYNEIYLSDFETNSLYASFSNVKAELTTKFSIKTHDRITDFSKVNFNENEKLDESIAKYLKPSEHIFTSGIVKEYALKITKGIKGDLEKARAIYNWVALNFTRDESVIGCGIGDAKAILESKKLYGKCTDISSVFVALLRSINIPARECFGIRLGESRFYAAMGSKENITKAQHCRAEFYLKGYGWIPCDPADVAKVKLSLKLDNNDSQIQKLIEFQFGNWEMCWCEFNTQRDFVLTPRPAQAPLNNFGYVYAEVDSNTLDYYSPSEFVYEYTSKQI